MIDDKSIKVIPSCRYLGVFIDNQPSFKTRIETLENKLFCGVGVLWKQRRYLYEKTMTLLYHALIKPHLLYAMLIWGSTCSMYKNRLSVLQSSDVRAIAGFHRQQHMLRAYSKPGILKLDDLYKPEIANSMFSYSNNSLPKPLQSLFIQSTDVHLHFTQGNSNLNFYFSSFKTSGLQQSFKYQGVKI